MASGIYTALSGAMADVQRMDVLSHNLANVSTPAFNQFRMTLESVQGESTAKELTFVKPTAPERDVRSGPLRSTENPMDIALTEGVYMAVDTGGKTAYVRGGTLMIHPDGTLTTNEGLTVLGEQNAIRLPPGTRSVVVAADGTVMADDSEAGKIRLREFEDPQALVQGPRRTVVDTGAAGAMPTVATQPVVAGYREESNLDLIRGMTDLIAAHRSYDVTLRAMQTFAQMEKQAATRIASRL